MEVAGMLEIVVKEANRETERAVNEIAVAAEIDTERGIGVAIGAVAMIAEIVIAAEAVQVVSVLETNMKGDESEARLK